MFWKNWPYWLKGGIWGIVISLLFVPFFLYQAGHGGGFMNFGYAADMLVLAFLPMSLACALFSLKCFDIPSLVQFIILGISFNVIFYFMVGAIIGSVFGIKSKKVKVIITISTIIVVIIIAICFYFLKKYDNNKQKALIYESCINNCNPANPNSNLKCSNINAKDCINQCVDLCKEMYNK